MYPEDKAELFEKAIFGKQVEDFLGTDIAKYLVKRAEAEEEEAMDQLKIADPSDFNTIRKLQNRIVVVESIQQWLADAIVEGQHALAIIEGE